MSNARTSYNVQAAGGFTRLADKRRTFVHQPNGLIERRPERPAPGALVVVPENPTKHGITFSVVVAGIAQMLCAS